MDCTTEFATPFCGPKNVDESLKLQINEGSSYLLEDYCSPRVYPADSELCHNVLPPKGSPAKGLMSDSLPSYLFSFFCPNVGFGYDDILQ